MNARTQALMIDFLNRAFRDVVDADYVAARACHRLNLPPSSTALRNDDLQVRQRFRKSERKSDLLPIRGITSEIVGLSTC